MRLLSSLMMHPGSELIRTFCCKDYLLALLAKALGLADLQCKTASGFELICQLQSISVSQHEPQDDHGQCTLAAAIRLLSLVMSRCMVEQTEDDAYKILPNSMDFVRQLLYLQLYCLQTHRLHPSAGMLCITIAMFGILYPGILRNYAAAKEACAQGVCQLPFTQHTTCICLHSMCKC